MERAIHNAIQAVEEGPAHPLLTDAVVLLGKAKDKVADYVDAYGDPAKDGWENDYPQRVDKYGVVRSS